MNSLTVVDWGRKTSYFIIAVFKQHNVAFHCDQEVKENMMDFQIYSMLSFSIPSFHENVWNEFATSFRRCQDLDSCVCVFNSADQPNSA
jgi:hypothetical protein